MCPEIRNVIGLIGERDRLTDEASYRAVGMDHGYCRLSCAPLRVAPDLVSEMVSQMLFAETFEILAEERHFWKVRLTHDGYEGWLDLRQGEPLSESDYAWFQSESATHYVLDQHCLGGVEDRTVTLLRGTPLPGYADGKFVLPGGKIGWVRGQVGRAQPYSPKALLATLEAYAHAPYLWGGRSPVGIDCSGLVQMVYRTFGKALPRDSSDQRACGKVIGSLTEAQLGDLAFFAAWDESSHVGIIGEDGHVIHASAFVRTDRLDEKGIVHQPSGERTHRLLEIRRLDLSEI